MKKIYLLREALKGILKSGFTGGKFRVPFFVHWTLTYRCDSRCRYCSSWKIKCPELDLKDICCIIGQFRDLGTLGFSISGGEPLLRDDLKDIVKFISDKGMMVNISSSGRLLPEKIKELSSVNSIKLSLDGPEEIHDYLKGQGSFKALDRAIEACLKYKINFAFNMVITKYNMNCLDYVLEFARRLNTHVVFQPATLELLFERSKENPTIPDPDLYRRFMGLLIEKKKDRRYNSLISNSMVSLHYLYKWPDKTEIPCRAGLFFCHVDPNGALYACNRWRWGNDKIKTSGIDTKSVRENFYEAIPPHCNQCWCKLADINFFLSGNAMTLTKIFKLHL